MIKKTTLLLVFALDWFVRNTEFEKENPTLLEGNQQSRKNKLENASFLLLSLSDGSRQQVTH